MRVPMSYRKFKSKIKTAGTEENAACPQILLYDIQINMLAANICVMYSFPTIHNLGDLNFDLSRSRKD